MITETHICCQKVPEKNVVKDAYPKKVSKMCQQVHFERLSTFLSTRFSQLPFAQIDQSWCLSDREFPEFFKTPLTFNLSVT